MKSILLIAIAALACAVSSMAQNVPNYIPTDGLVGWWPFNGNANDESGNTHHGVLSGPTLHADRFANPNSSYLFNGLSDKITIPFSNSIQLTNSFTISAWCFPYEITGFDPNASMIVSKWTNNSSQSFQYLIQDSKLDASIQNPINGQTVSTNNIGPDSIWYHMVFQFKFPDTVSLYINNNLTQNYILQNSGLNTPQVPIYFGAREIYSNQFDNFYKGILDDIGIWSRALTPQEITALYTASPTNNGETVNTSANVPGAISYQAVARDAQGAPLADTNVQVQFTLIADSLSGSEEYVETHTLSTNSLGLFTTAFGAGTPVSNTFGNINWSAGNKYLNVQIDTGNGLVDMGTQQLLSTPYSLYSAKAGEIKNPGLPVFSDNAAALAGGLVAGDMYRTAAGDLKIVF